LRWVLEHLLTAALRMPTARWIAFGFSERGDTMLQAVDIAVAYQAAMLDHQESEWSAARIRKDLGLPKATLSESLRRADEARLLRGKFVLRGALAALLPVLPNLVPVARPMAGRAQGIPTGASAPVFGGHFTAEEPEVWPLAGAGAIGVAIRPLHPAIPARLTETRDARAYALLAFLDAVRSGRAREVAHGVEGLRLLCGLPASPGVYRHAAVGALMRALVDAVLAGGGRRAGAGTVMEASIGVALGPVEGTTP
jgi:hypothetical protein